MITSSHIASRKSNAKFGGQGLEYALKPHNSDDQPAHGDPTGSRSWRRSADPGRRAPRRAWVLTAADGYDGFICMMSLVGIRRIGVYGEGEGNYPQ